MKKYHRITRQIGFNYVSMFLIFLITPFLIFLLTRTLSISDFGVYSLLATAVEIIIVLLDGGLPQYVITRFPGLDKKNKIRGFFSLYLTEILFLIIILIIIVFSNIDTYIFSVLGIPLSSSIFLISLAIIFCGTLIRLNSSYFTANQEIGLQTFIDFMNRCFWIILLGVFSIFIRKMNILNVFIIWLVGGLIVVSISWFLMKKDIAFFIRHLSFNPAVIKKWLLFGLPLIFYNVGAYIIAMSDRYIISYFHGNTYVGFYALAYSITMIVMSMGAIIPLIFYPYISEMWNTKKNYHVLFNASLKYGFMIIVPMTAGVFVLREQLVSLISGVSYLPSAKIIPILVLFPLFAFLSNIFYQIMLLREKTRLIAGVYLSIALLNIILNLMFVPHYKMAGAATATSISYICMFMVTFLINRKFVKPNFGFLRMGRIILASVIMALFVWIINPMVLVSKIVTILSGVLVYFSLLFIMGTFVPQELNIVKVLFFGKLNKLKIVRLSNRFIK